MLNLNFRKQAIQFIIPQYSFDLEEKIFHYYKYKIESPKKPYKEHNIYCPNCGEKIKLIKIVKKPL